MGIESVIGRFRERIVSGTTGLFQHAPYPLAGTLSYPGDPGLLGPDSVSWRVIGDVAAFFGGIRALLVQAAHPEVVAGVAQHSAYRSDPLGRLSRTSAYVTATTYGAMPEVEQAVAVVRGAHRPVRGRSHRDRPYSAGNPAMAAWVHNALTDSFLVTYQFFGPQPLSGADADRFVEEQSAVGRLLDADPLPITAPELGAWLAGHPDGASSPGLHEVVSFLRKPPLPLPIRAGYSVLFAAAAATLPPPLRRILGVRRLPGAILSGRLMSRFLRWALGSSPSWHIALVRAGASVPPGMFRQPLPIAGVSPAGAA